MGTLGLAKRGRLELDGWRGGLVELNGWRGGLNLTDGEWMGRI